MKRLIRIGLSLAVASNAFAAFPVGAATLTSGMLIKGTSFPAVYYYAENGKRYVFPNEKTYKTWYADFSGVTVISDGELGNIAIGGNVTYRPGVKMLKIQSMPNVYAVAKGGLLRWVKTEAIASAYYGSDWNTKIEDLPDSFFVNYSVGADIDDSTDYNMSAETASSPNINVDKGLVVFVAPKTVEVTISRTNYNATPVTVNKGDTVRWTNTDTINHSVTSDPHPSHTNFPSLDSGVISSGLSWSLTFNQTGTYGYHDHVNNPAMTGSVTVVQP